MKQFNIKFYGNRRIFFGISLAIIAVGLIFNLIFGTQMDIQFKGGAMVKYSYTGEISQESVEQIVQKALSRDVSVSINENVQASDGKTTLNNVSISFAGSDSISLEDQQTVAKAMAETYPDAGFEVVQTNSVNPTMGQKFFLKCIVAIALTFLLLVVYIAFRFKKIGGMSAAVMAIIALMHDVLMVYFTFVIFRIPINDNFIAVVLTILGYSLNDTVVIYDRIRENRKLMGGKTPIDVLVDSSINQTLTRSLNTSICTFLAVTVVFVVGSIYQLSSVTTFALPMMIGIVTGCYSSVCLAGPMYVMWQKHKEGKKKKASAK